MTPGQKFDVHMMRIALEMARRGLGSTAPNPSVGAVIADEVTGEVIARGWTQPGGRPHAEKEALRRGGELSSERARGKTMYVTLEPCAHTGRVPTCADAMQTAGLKRVVCALADPNPVVAGRGFQQLRDAGVQVDVGLLSEDAAWVTRGHVLRLTQARPFVQIKMALDSAFAIAEGDGAPVWVTSVEGRAFAHLLRAEADAILVGAGTLRADDPQLDCRLPGLADRSPDRVIVGTIGDAAHCKAFRTQDGKPRIWVASAVEGLRVPQGVAALGDVSDGKGGVKLDALLAALAKNGITRLLVEGGPRMWSSFLAAGLVDEVIVAVAPERGRGTMRTVLPTAPAAYFAKLGFSAADQFNVGPDRVQIFQRRDA